MPNCPECDNWVPVSAWAGEPADFVEDDDLTGEECFYCLQPKDTRAGGGLTRTQRCYRWALAKERRRQ